MGKPKTNTKVNCNGSCCKNCSESDKIHQVLAIPKNEAGKTTIYDCALEGSVKKEDDDTDATKTKYKFNICKADKHIVKYNDNISEFKRIKNSGGSNVVESNNQVIIDAPQQIACEINTCCKTCVTTDAMHILEGEITPDSTNNNNKQIVHVIIDAKKKKKKKKKKFIFKIHKKKKKKKKKKS